jgi:AraC-like DNA-binding protein
MSGMASQDNKTLVAGGEARRFSARNLADVGPIARRVPVLEAYFTQFSGDDPIRQVDLVTSDGVMLYRSLIQPPSVSGTVLDPAYVAFILPVWGAREFVINGMTARPSVMHLACCENTFHVRGGSRMTLAVTLPRCRFIETVAALRGVGPEDVVLDDRPLELDRSWASLLHRRLTALVRIGATPDLANDVFGVITDTYLRARRDASAEGRSFRRAQKIVSVAEERFAAAGGDPVSLADLCSAARVGKTTLYKAFENVVGRPPLEYFKKRRLTNVRSELLNSAPARGAVKRAALDAGLTELGRFAVEYRAMFGESPSVTLARNLPRGAA